MKVYAVSTGAYSDYSVNVLFRDRSLAEAHAVEIGGDVEEFELLDEAPTRFVVYNISNDTYAARAGMDQPHEWSYPAWSYQRGAYKRAEVTEWGRGSLRVSGWDQEAVRQAFRDRAARLALGRAKAE